jgi:hypothetical protein
MMLACNQQHPQLQMLWVCYHLLPLLLLLPLLTLLLLLLLLLSPLLLLLHVSAGLPCVCVAAVAQG